MTRHNGIMIVDERIQGAEREVRCKKCKRIKLHDQHSLCRNCRRG